MEGEQLWLTGSTFEHLGHELRSEPRQGAVNEVVGNVDTPQAVLAEGPVGLLLILNHSQVTETRSK